jgi:hypothetical protein
MKSTVANRGQRCSESITGGLFPFEAYYYHSRRYNKRLLTNTPDVYNAFAGILFALYASVSLPDKSLISLYYLPLHDFNAAILLSALSNAHDIRATDGTTYVPS